MNTSSWINDSDMRMLIKRICTLISNAFRLVMGELTLTRFLWVSCLQEIEILPYASLNVFITPEIPVQDLTIKFLWIHYIHHNPFQRFLSADFISCLQLGNSLSDNTSSKVTWCINSNGRRYIWASLFALSFAREYPPVASARDCDGSSSFHIDGVPWLKIPRDAPPTLNIRFWT